MRGPVGLRARSAIGGREYVDGGVWSPTNLDAAPAGRGTQVLCLRPTASLPAAALAAGALRAFSSTAVVAETLVLQARGAAVAHVGPDAESAAAMGTDLMDAQPRRGGPRRGVRAGRAGAPLTGVGVSCALGRLLLLGLLGGGGDPPLGVGQRAHVGAARPPR